jgi:aminoglycoside 3-N-acetyltransferase I
MTAYAIHRLAGADLSRLKGLLAVFADAFEDADTYQGAVPPDDYLHSFLTLPHVVVLTAEAGEMVVGGLVAYEMVKFERERREIYIYDLAVLADHRRRKIATALIGRLQQIARDRGAYVIFVQADRGDAPAIALYESLGVREDVYHFDIRVD